MEPEGSLTLLKVPATCPYPEPARSHLLKIILFFFSAPVSSELSLPSGFPTKALYAHLLSLTHATCPANPILDFIARKIIGEEYRS
jgi:hypothetical protein